MVYRSHAMAREWVKQGHAVTIVASGYSHFRWAQPDFTGRVGEEWLDGVRTLWLRTPRYTASSNIGRVLSMIAYTAQCQWLSLPLGAHYDIVMCSSPHPFSIYPAYKFTQRYRARLIYDIRDLWPLTLKLLGNISVKHPFIRLMQRAEDFACRHADLVTSVPQNAGPYLASRGLPRERFLPIANGALLEPPNQEHLPSIHATALEAIRQRATCIVAYAGTLGTANAMSDVIHAMARVSQGVHIVIVGDGNERQSLIRLADELGVRDRVHLLPPLSRSQVQQFLKEADIGYAGTNHSPLYEYGASLTKLNDYMIASLPVVYAVGDKGNPIEASGAGICCKASDIEAIAESISYLAAQTKQFRHQMGERGRLWCLRNQLVSEQVRRILATLANLPRRNA